MRSTVRVPRGATMHTVSGSVAPPLPHQPNGEYDQEDERKHHRCENARIRAPKFAPMRSAAFRKLRTRRRGEELGRLLFHRVVLSGFGWERARFPAHTTPAR